MRCGSRGRRASARVRVRRGGARIRSRTTSRCSGSRRCAPCGASRRRAAADARGIAAGLVEPSACPEHRDCRRGFALDPLDLLRRWDAMRQADDREHASRRARPAVRARGSVASAATSPSTCGRSRRYQARTYHAAGMRSGALISPQNGFRAISIARVLTTRAAAGTRRTSSTSTPTSSSRPRAPGRAAGHRTRRRHRVLRPLTAAHRRRPTMSPVTFNLAEMFERVVDTVPEREALVTPDPSPDVPRARRRARTGSRIISGPRASGRAITSGCS